MIPRSTLLSSMIAAAALAAPFALSAARAEQAKSAPSGATIHQVQMMWDDEDDPYARRPRWRGREDWRGGGGRFDCNEHRCIDQRTGDLWYSSCDYRGCRPTRFARPAGRW